MQINTFLGFAEVGAKIAGMFAVIIFAWLLFLMALS